MFLRLLLKDKLKCFGLINFFRVFNSLNDLLLIVYGFFLVLFYLVYNSCYIVCKFYYYFNGNLIYLFILIN